MLNLLILWLVLDVFKLGYNCKVLKRMPLLDLLQPDNFSKK